MTSKVRSGLRIPYDMNTILIKMAEERGISKNALMLQALWEWIKRNEST